MSESCARRRFAEAVRERVQRSMAGPGGTFDELMEAERSAWAELTPEEQDELLWLDVEIEEEMAAQQ